MKRPELVTMFSPSRRPLPDTVRALLAALPDGDRGFMLSKDYARIEHTPDEGFYDFTDEQLGVITGEDDLIARLVHDGGGMWSCVSNLRFHSSDIDVYHYHARENPIELNTAISTDSHVTRFLEEEDAGRGAYFSFIGRIARALDASFFASAVHARLHPLSATSVSSRAGFEATFGTSPYPYIIGWQEQALDVAEVAAGWEQEPSDVQRTLSGYAVLHRLPDAR